MEPSWVKVMCDGIETDSAAHASPSHTGKRRPGETVEIGSEYMQEGRRNQRQSTGMCATPDPLDVEPGGGLRTVKASRLLALVGE